MIFRTFEGVCNSRITTARISFTSWRIVTACLRLLFFKGRQLSDLKILDQNVLHYFRPLLV